MGKTFDEIVKIINEANLTVEDVYKLNAAVIKKGKNLVQNIRSELKIGDSVKLNSVARGKTADKYRNAVGVITKIMRKNVVVDFYGNNITCPPSLLTKK